MVGIDTDAIAAGDLGRHLLAQGRQAGHRAILIVAGTDRPACRIEQGLGAVEIGKTLGQVQGAGLRGELGHGGKDGRADVRQLAADHGALFPAIFRLEAARSETEHSGLSGQEKGCNSRRPSRQPIAGKPAPTGR
ncbi:hypothetical protein D3C77_595410 [compost metagenome]